MSRQFSFSQYAAIRRYQYTVALSPDADNVAYSINTSGQYNLWTQPTAGGYPQQITLSDTQAVRTILWSPDDESFVFTADNDGDEFTKIYRVPVRGGQIEELVATDQVQHFMGEISHDGEWLAYAANDREPTAQDIMLYNLKTGEHKRIVDDGKINHAGQWSPDDTRLVTASSTSNTDISIGLWNAETHEYTEITPHDGEVIFIPVGWDADGVHLYARSDEGRDFQGLIRINTQTHERDWIATPDWDVADAMVSGDSRRLFWVMNENGQSRVFVRDLDADGDAEDREIPMPVGVAGGMDVSTDGETIVLQWARPTQPTEIFVIDVDGGTASPITESALGGLPEEAFTEPELIHYPSFDREIPAWLYKPAHVDGPIPVVLSIHGGPEAQELPTYIYSGLYQYLTNRGIAVLAPNVRGSTGYGKDYQKLIHRDWGGDELKDFEHAAKWLQAQNWVDAERLAVWGGSFGGFATLSCMSRLPEYWACGVDLVGPANLVTFAKAVPPTWRHMMTAWVGDPETEVDFLMERSPITYVDQITAPLFVIQGANDPRVVKAESDQIVEKLRDRGVDVRYDVYDDEGHGFTKRSNEVKAYTDIVGFLEKHLLKK